jgi:hypothetical protein
MRNLVILFLATAIVNIFVQTEISATDIFFNPLTQSAAVASPNHINELNSPWQVPAGLTQANLLSLQEVEADVNQSVVRVLPADTPAQASMFDMIAYDPTGNFLFIPHETPFGAGVSRHDIANRTTAILPKRPRAWEKYTFLCSLGRWLPSPWRSTTGAVQSHMIGLPRAKAL